MRTLIVAATLVAGGAFVGTQLNDAELAVKPTTALTEEPGDLATQSEPVTNDLGMSETRPAVDMNQALITAGDLPGFTPTGYDPAPTTTKLCPFVVAATHVPIDRVSVGYQEQLSGRMAAQTITEYEPGVAGTYIASIRQGTQDCHQFSDDLGAWTVTSQEQGTTIHVALDAHDQGIAIDVTYHQIGNFIITSMTAGWDGHRPELVAAMTVKAAARLG